jgi:hypothetical protein
MFGNTELGLLFSGTYADEDNYNYALGFDAAYRRGFDRLILQGALSEKNEKRGFALSAGYMGFLGSFRTAAVAEVIQDSFDVEGIGFVPWVGRKRFRAYTGPYTTFETGALRELHFGPGVDISQEPGEDDWSKGGWIFFNPEFRNDWGIWLSAYGAQSYQADTNYFAHGADWGTWGPLGGYHMHFGGYVSYDYNYWRGFLAYRGGTWWNWGFMVVPEFSITLSTNWWIEWDPEGSVLGITPQFRPGFHFRPNPYFEVRIRNDFVWYMPEGKFSDVEWVSNRWMLFLGWNFKPKSWVYIAVNDYRVQDMNGDLSLLNRIGAIKVKYLIYF